MIVQVSDESMPFFFGGVKVFDHGFGIAILTKEQLTDALHRHDLLRDSHTTFKPHWVLKYSVFIGTRNVVKDKG